MSDPRLGPLRAEFKALTGKNPSPRLDADALAAKLEEVKAAAAAAPGATAEGDGDGGANEAEAAAKPEAKAKAKPAAKAKADDKEPEAAPDAPEGPVYLRHPEGIGASYAGVELAPDKKGRVLAPASAAAELAAHGFEAL